MFTFSNFVSYDPGSPSANETIRLCLRRIPIGFVQHNSNFNPPQPHSASGLFFFLLSEIRVFVNFYFFHFAFIVTLNDPRFL